MNKISSKFLFFIVAIILIVTALIGLYMLQKDGDNPNGIQRIDWAQQANEIVSHDSNVSELLGNKYVFIGGIVKNESYAEMYYSHDGKIYHIDVNYDNKKVTSIYEEQNTTVLEWLKSINVTAREIKT